MHRRSGVAITFLALSGLSLMHRLLGFVREQVVAGQFGASAVTDAYVAAQSLPTMLHQTVSAATDAVLVPLFVAAMALNHDAVKRLFSTIFITLGGFMLLEALLLWVGAPTIMRILVPGLEAEAMQQGITLARIFAPAVALTGLASLAGSVLQVHDRFLLPAGAALAGNLNIVLAALFFQDRLQIETIASAAVIGYAVQVGLLWLQLRTIDLKTVRLNIDWSIVRQGLVLAWPLLLANAILQVSPLTEKVLGSKMAEGSISALNYAHKLILLPAGVIAITLGTLLFPRFARWVQQGEIKALTAHVEQTLRILMFVLVPGAGLMIVLARPLVTLAFARGNFTADAVIATSQALQVFALALVPLGALPLLTKLLFAFKDTRAQLGAVAGSVITYLGFAIMLSPHMGHRGLALAFVLGQWTHLVWIASALTRYIGRPALSAALLTLPRAGIATFAASGTVWAVVPVTMSTLGQLTLGGLLSGLVYLITQSLFRSQDLHWAYGSLKKVVGGRES